MRRKKVKREESNIKPGPAIQETEWTLKIHPGVGEYDRSMELTPESRELIRQLLEQRIKNAKNNYNE